MTIIKYGTIQRDPHLERVMWARGKKDSGYYICKCDDCSDSELPIKRLFKEKVVELPDRMTPTEYSDWLDSEEGTEFVRDELMTVQAEYGYIQEEQECIS